MHRTVSPPADGLLLRSALPLLIVGAASFVVAFVVARDAGHAGFGHLPLWALFGAIGAVVTGGGVTVLVAGHDPEEGRPFYDPREYVLVPKARYERLISSTPEAPAAAPPVRRSLPAWSESEPAPAPTPAAAPSVPVPAGRGGAPGRTGFAPSPDFLPKVDEAIGEMEHLLDQLRQESDREARILGRPARVVLPDAPERRSAVPPPPTRASGSPPAAPRAAAPAVSAPARARAAPVSVPPSPRALVPSSPEPEACGTCGRSIPATARGRHCSVCGGPMCPACLIRAKRAGHPDVCSRCSPLLPTDPEEPARTNASRRRG